jgi:D-beta-D-heptose 7-phosphate kinase/D-beta-D-heptose 1-phosphate adenosyltransferase
VDARIIDRLADADVLVVGDVLLDRFVEGEVARISREAPVPVLSYHGVRVHLGGAGNAAANVLGYGGRATLVAITGDDGAASEIGALCASFPRMAARLIVDAGRATSVKTRYLSGWQQLLCVNADDGRPASAAAARSLLAESKRALATTGALVISDYARGTLDESAITALIAAARTAGKPTVVDPRRADPSVFTGATVVTPNKEEMAALTGISADSDDAAEAAAGALLARAAIGAVLVTRGAAGMTLVERDRPPLHVRAETHRVFDVTGAGDTVVATLAAALAVGIPLTDAVRLANVAAGIKVSKPGTATVTPQELRHAFGAAMGDGVAGPPAATAQVAAWQALGLKVGFTNGVFDLVHRGHLHSLEQAARRADRLVVGVNSDASTRRLKGNGRPVQDQATRAAVLAALRFVDLVVVFDEDTPEALIRALKPDLLFKGADYSGKEVPGAAFVTASGGEVALLPLLEGHSTTGTVKRVRGDA